MLHRRLHRVHVAALSIAVWLGHASRVLGADPTTADCLVSNDRSIALRNQHQLRAARAELLVCAAPTCPGDIRTECVRRVADVNAQMPTIVFEVRDADGNDLSAVSVTMDGQPLVERIEGTALSIDPGKHEFTFTAPNLAPMQKNWVIREGEKGRRERVSLSLTSRQAVEPLAEAPASAFTSSPPPAAATQAGGGLGTQRIVGIAVAGLGVVGLGVALYEQLNASSRYSSSQKAVDSTDLGVRGTAHPLYQQAKRAQNYAIMFGAIGAVAVGAGLVLMFVGSEESEPHDEAITHQSITPALGPGGGGIVYSATF